MIVVKKTWKLPEQRSEILENNYLFLYTEVS